MPRFRSDLESINTYIPGKPIDEVMREYGVTDIVKLASNECPQEPFPAVQEAIATASRESHRYPDTAAHDLNQALAAHLDLDPTAIWVGPGSTSILTSIALAMGGPGTSAVFSQQSFVLYGISSAIAATEPVTVPIGRGLHIDIDALAAAVKPDTTLLYMCNPNNPTGTYVGPDAIDRLVDAVPADVLVVIDEAYEEYVTRPDHATAIPHAVARDNVVVTRTFSKIYGIAGLRVGYAVGQPATIAALRRLQLPFATTNVGLAAAVEALRHQDQVAERVKENARGRDQLAAGLGDLGVGHLDSQTNFVFTGPFDDAAGLCDRLLQLGVIVRQFGPYVRVTTGTEAENIRFLDSLGDLL